MTTDRVTRLLAALKTIVAELEFGNQQLPLALDREHMGICQAWDDADHAIAQTEAELVAESAPVHPHNAIIRQAKRILEVLNVPEGGAICWTVAFGWFIGEQGWNSQHRWLLPDSCLPRPSEEICITASTEEFK